MKRRIGMIGSTATLASTYTAAASSRRPAATITAEVVEAQPKLLPASDTQISRVEMPETIRVAPR